MRMETFIRKQLRMKSHYITHIEETDQVVIAHVARIGKRKLRCSNCRATCRWRIAQMTEERNAPF